MVYKLTSLSKAVGSSISLEEIAAVLQEASEWPPGIFRKAFLSLAARMKTRYEEQTTIDKNSNK